MDKEEKLLIVQRLRDVAKSVQVTGKTETAPFSPRIIMIICEMQLSSQEWLAILEDEIRRM